MRLVEQMPSAEGRGHFPGSWASRHSLSCALEAPWDQIIWLKSDGDLWCTCSPSNWKSVLIRVPLPCPSLHLPLNVYPFLWIPLQLSAFPPSCLNSMVTTPPHPTSAYSHPNCPFLTASQQYQWDSEQFSFLSPFLFVCVPYMVDHYPLIVLLFSFILFLSFYT